MTKTPDGSVGCCPPTWRRNSDESVFRTRAVSDAPQLRHVITGIAISLAARRFYSRRNPAGGDGHDRAKRRTAGEEDLPCAILLERASVATDHSRHFQYDDAVTKRFVSAVRRASQRFIRKSVRRRDLYQWSEKTLGAGGP